MLKKVKFAKVLSNIIRNRDTKAVGTLSPKAVETLSPKSVVPEAAIYFKIC